MTALRSSDRNALFVLTTDGRKGYGRRQLVAGRVGPGTPIVRAPLLRQVLADHRRPAERRVVNYIANLMALFVNKHRLYRIDSADAEAYEYLVDMIAHAAEADRRRRFLVHAHVGNYSLFMTGVFGAYLEERFKNGRRTVNGDYYADLGSASYSQASALPPAQEFDLTEVFVRLALTFDTYRRAMATVAADYMV